MSVFFCVCSLHVIYWPLEWDATITIEHVSKHKYTLISIIVKEKQLLFAEMTAKKKIRTYVKGNFEIKYLGGCTGREGTTSSSIYKFKVNSIKI